MNEFGALALRCGPTVAPSTLASIAQTESRFQPLTINDNTTATSGAPATPEIAVQIATRLLEAGHSIDLGLMQINSANFGKLGLTPAQAFDPCHSIAAAAAILTGDYAGGDSHAAQQSALRDAISKYNTGDAERGFENGYVHKVELAARQIVPSLDVGAAQVMPVSRAARSAVAAPDPNAPPPWDVWGSLDSNPHARSGGRDSGLSGPDPGQAALADAAEGPTALGIFQGQN